MKLTDQLDLLWDFFESFQLCTRSVDNQENEYPKRLYHPAQENARRQSITRYKNAIPQGHLLARHHYKGYYDNVDGQTDDL